MTEITQHVMDRADAEQLTERIRLTAATAREKLQKLRNLISEAAAGGAHVALGYASFNAYLSDVLGSEPLRLERVERPEFSNYLTGPEVGMSTRDAAKVLGVSHPTVLNDQASTGKNLPVEPSSNGQALEGHIIDPPATREVHSHDGKTRTYPANTTRLSDHNPPQKRDNYPKKFNNTVSELDQLVTKLNELTEDPKFGRCRNDLRAYHSAVLEDAHGTLTGIINKLN